MIGRSYDRKQFVLQYLYRSLRAGGNIVQWNDGGPAHSKFKIHEHGGFVLASCGVGDPEHKGMVFDRMHCFLFGVYHLYYDYSIIIIITVLPTILVSYMHNFYSHIIITLNKVFCNDKLNYRCLAFGRDTVYMYRIHI